MLLRKEEWGGMMNLRIHPSSAFSDLPGLLNEVDNEREKSGV